MVETASSDLAHRAMYWHIDSPYKFFIYPLALVACGICAYGCYQRYKFWRGGKPDTTRTNNWWKRFKLLVWDVPLQRRVLQSRSPGITHVLVFWSFLVLLFTTIVILVDADFRLHVYQGRFYLFITLLADLAGLALFAGLVFSAVRRYVAKPERLENRWDDAFLLAILFVSVVTGFLLEGIRIHYTQDPWALYSPVGYGVSLAVGGMGEHTVATVYPSLWWFHFAVLFVFIAAFPYTKLFHMFLVPANIFFSSLEPKGALARVDIEALLNDPNAADNFNVGVSTVEDLTWKQRLDVDACIGCGRCEDVCPAHLAHHPLSPKKLVHDLKEFSWKHAKDSINGNGHAHPGDNGQPHESPLIVGGAFDPVTIWECRTCRACMEVCPARIDHVPHIMELRRAEVMMRGQVPQDASIALKTMERTGNPFGPQEARTQWIEEAQIPVLGPGEECDVLFWIGCCTTYDLCKQKVAYNLMSIFKEAGLKLAVLGDDEQCCGEPARSLGDENVFQTIVKNQIQAIESRKFKYLVAHCAHCYNVFKNDYPQFGAKFKVLHHTELISQLVREGVLKLDVPIEHRITYHDSCYLGRYNDMYEEPREILKAIKGAQLVEMKNNRERANCCGGGGGHYWMDIPNGERLNVQRVREAQETGAEIIAVGCIYCLHMFDDAIKILNLDDKMVVYDISELVVVASGITVDAALTCEIQALAA